MAAEASLAAVGFGLAASLSWGASDFSGGVAARRVPIAIVMIVSYAGGLALVVALALARGEPLASAADMIIAATAGLSGAIGLTAQYRALAAGRMGIVAPVSAVLGSALPVLFAAFSEGLPGSSQIAGFALALVGVWLIARTENGGERHAGLSYAVIAGVGFGGFFILMDRVSVDAVFWPLAAARGMSLAAMLFYTLVVSPPRRWALPGRRGLAVILLAGTLDVGGNTFFLLAAQAGRLDVATVLSSLYPAVTAVLARALLDERLSRVQTAGVLVAVIAIPLIAG